ncbi:MAG TPA: hypothetical protein VEK57_32095 [Thermoanaerobaculia bacterium]|nr:hypothetical protein [Thermoanaerobaculia bacterium]
MRRASPNELKESAFPVMTARLSEAELGKWFPVSFDEINDAWAAPEPSLGALVSLEAGEYVVLDYGRESNQLIVRIPANLDASSFLASFFREIPMPRARVLWRRADAKLPRTVAAKRIAVPAAISNRAARSSQSRQPGVAKKK